MGAWNPDAWVATLNATERAYVDQLRGSIYELLSMIAMVPEAELPKLRIDPYGTIGDALESIGHDRKPDSWTALQRFCGYPDPPPPPTEGSAPCSESP